MGIRKKSQMSLTFSFTLKNQPPGLGQEMVPQQGWAAVWEAGLLKTLTGLPDHLQIAVSWQADDVQT